MRIATIVVLLLVSFAAANANPGGRDWPRWRGPDGNSMSADTDWDPKAVSGSPRVLWKASVGQGFSSVAISGRYAFTLGNANGKDTVYCLDAETGRQIWSHSYPCGIGSYPGPRATATIDGDTVYTLSREGHLFALDTGSGKVRWQKHLTRDFGARPPQWDFAGSPVVAGGQILLNAGRAGLALDKKTGAKLWASGPGPGGYATPVLTEYGGKPAAVIFGQNAVFGVSLSTGAELWSFDWQTGSDVNAADPVAFDGRVFVASAYDKGCALLDVTVRPPVALWRSDAFKTHFSSFVRHGGYIYGIDGDARQPSAGVLTCLDERTGQPAWSARLGFGSLIAVGGRLIVLSSAGTLVVAEMAPAGYRELARGALPRDQYWTPPTFARGRLFVRNLRGDVFAIDLR